MAFRANASRLQSQRLASMIASVLQRMASPSTRFAAMHGPGPADGSGLAPPRDFTLPRDFMLPRALVSCIDRHSRMLPHGFMSLRDPMLPRFVSHRDTKALRSSDSSELFWCATPFRVRVPGPALPRPFCHCSFPRWPRWLPPRLPPSSCVGAVGWPARCRVPRTALSSACPRHPGLGRHDLVLLPLSGPATISAPF